MKKIFKLMFLLSVLSVFLVACNQKDGESEQVVLKDLSEYKEVKFDLEKKAFHGDKDAPIEIVVFEDYECPHCLNWTNNVYPTIEEYYIDKDVAKIYYYNLFFMSNTSQLKALIAKGVENEHPDKLDDYTHLMYNLTTKDKTKFHTEDGGKELTKFLNEKIPGVNFADIINMVVNRNPELEAGLQETNEVAQKHGVQSTPTVFINGRQLENSGSIEEMNNIMKQVLKDNDKFKVVEEGK